LKVSKGFVKAGQVDSAAMIDRLVPAMLARTKGTGKAALGLLELAAGPGGDCALKGRVAPVAAEGLGHEAAELQAAILDVIERHGDLHDRRLRELLEPCAAGIAPSLRGRFEAWLGKTPKKGKEPLGDELDDLARRAEALDKRLASLAGV